MYGLDPKTSLDFLIGATLQQVCFGQHQVILNFEADNSIAVESALAITAGSKEARFNDLLSSSSELLDLLGHSVEGASATREGTLSLAFSNGSELSIFDTSEQYESYQITFGGDQIVV